MTSWVGVHTGMHVERVAEAAADETTDALRATGGSYGEFLETNVTIYKVLAWVGAMTIL